MSLAEYVDRAFEQPLAAAHASRYLLAAIESAGTREVVENGERAQRYRFFDDPHNDGEHAVLGNTATLNAFVDDVRAIAAGRGKAETILWFAGPTATGKSELKRCLINGLREFSKTDAGRRYTIEWNVSDADRGPGLTYGEEPVDREDDWYESPVQASPLSVFPTDVREDVLADVNDHREDADALRADADLPPFSREAYDHLEQQYRREGVADVFAAATDPKHLRVKNYVVERGQGIGVLHSEDAGSPKERLVGSWVAGLLGQLDSKGRKNPQAFSYDGVLSQGNGCLTIMEDASQHADLLQKLLNVPDERRVKLDKGIGMDLDTQLVVISNLDLEAQLNKHDDRQGFDPLKALKRRLSKHELGYLTSISLEAQLLRRELTGDAGVWTATDPEVLAERAAQPVTVSVRDDDGETERELAPHTIEAAALYSVVTRLDDDDHGDELSLVEKALLFDRGYVGSGEDRRDASEFDLADGADGANGIPVTYTRDVLADRLHADADRSHPDLAVERVITPGDVLSGMVDGLSSAPVFSDAERAEFNDRVAVVEAYIHDQQAEDVRDAVLAGEGASESAVEEYVDNVHAWATGDTVENARGEQAEPDALSMKLFETETLGRFDADTHYHGNDPTPAVETFREDTVMTAVTRHAWEHRDDEFHAHDVDLSTVPVLRDVLAGNDWDDVKRVHPEFDPTQWADPPEGTDTAAVKADAISFLVSERGYSRASAELASRSVISEVTDEWD
ncbi:MULTISPECIES: PrkA family serine protein kinase [Halobacterium]|uniref:Kinase anchor protein n=5 Tax=Halobacterium salinarum TaxID=2242 RepID=Q9HRD5_HALSA|nr:MULTISPECIES: PrkA family serine protein kinase [Halobacterium]AAG19223.1 kinase anchor protein [Halobacterium salinarum NRC-1]MCF2165352.1 PrkA family serine protein kinase [Halobacterium salinarum]MCF2168852.1 PrkA family serine protein kinase [Halobacterium salinarum]MCF2207938.1 PrkA family serine protein kinase [Halobacterium salinarum]MCF2239163.1 PrkA family serine protein kinase [Halobacterium salinarum]